MTVLLLFSFLMIVMNDGVDCEVVLQGRSQGRIYDFITGGLEGEAGGVGAYGVGP